jgi:hypothetical protein
MAQKQAQKQIDVVVLGAVVWVPDARQDVVLHYVIDGGGKWSPERVGVPNEWQKLSEWLKAGWLIENASGWGSTGTVFVLRASPGGF